MHKANSGRTPLPSHVLEKKILIIGAGISGLSCAEKLVKHHFENVKILEASNRIGGRLYTLACAEKIETGKTYDEIIFYVSFFSDILFFETPKM